MPASRPSNSPMSYTRKEPQESADYPAASKFVVEQIRSIMQDAIDSGRNKIFIHTNLRRGLPLENINKIAGPFVEAWAVEQFELLSDQTGNRYELINTAAGRRLDPFDIILQFRWRRVSVDYVDANVDVKATAEDIENSGKSPNITSFARCRTAYVADPDYIFIVLSLKHKVFSEPRSDTGMTNGIMQVNSCAVYDFKYIADGDLSYNPALGTGQLQIRDIHYVSVTERTTQQFCELLDRKFIHSRGEGGWLTLAQKHGWIK